MSFVFSFSRAPWWILKWCREHSNISDWINMQLEITNWNFRGGTRSHSCIDNHFSIFWACDIILTTASFQTLDRGFLNFFLCFSWNIIAIIWWMFQHHVCRHRPKCAWCFYKTFHELTFICQWTSKRLAMIKLNLCLPSTKHFTDQYQYLGNCPPTPPLTQH